MNSSPQSIVLSSRTSFYPFANGNFATSSGKAELYSEDLKEQGLDPGWHLRRPVNREVHKPKRFPWRYWRVRRDNFLNSTFSNVAAIQKENGVGPLEMKAADHGPEESSTARRYAFQPPGRYSAESSRVDGAVQAGVISAKLHWAKLSSGSRNINVLTWKNLRP